MLKIRLIPILLLKNGLIVRSESFKFHQIIGDPITQLSRYNRWSVDELIYIDISSDDHYDVRREDAKIETSEKRSLLDIIEVVSKSCFVPLTFGGRIRTLNDIRSRVARGADKVTLNYQAIMDPGFITQAAKVFGNQCIVVSIDVLKNVHGQYEVFTSGRQKATGLDPVQWAKEVARLGAGEILLNSIDRDGTAAGFDSDLIRSVVTATSIPVIACGGAGKFKDFVTIVQEAKPSAVAAANLFHFTELSYRHAKKEMLKGGLNVRS